MRIGREYMRVTIWEDNMSRVDDYKVYARNVEICT
jgi:hypothetical protein